MDTLLGLLGLILFVVGVLTLSAVITYTVVKLTPRRDDKPSPS
jgi:hypothetical protein